MLSLLCPAALAKYDKCERPNGGWAGFDQVSKSLPVSEPTGKRASATSSDKTCTALCREMARPVPIRSCTATTTSTLADTRTLCPSPPVPDHS